MEENFIKQVLSTDFYSPIFWESVNTKDQVPLMATWLKVTLIRNLTKKGYW